jgi:AbrB family looped-hinge helix DNA binding protein
MAEVTLSAKNQITLPMEARTALGAEAGDSLVVAVRGDVVVLMRKPKQHNTAIRGLAKQPYPSGYLRRERQSWE